MFVLHYPFVPFRSVLGRITRREHVLYTGQLNLLWKENVSIELGRVKTRRVTRQRFLDRPFSKYHSSARTYVAIDLRLPYSKGMS